MKVKKKNLFRLLLMVVSFAALMMVVLPVFDQTAEAASPTNYVKEDGTTPSLPLGAAPLPAAGPLTDAAPHNGWYYVDANTLYTGSLTITGGIKIVICNGCTLTVSAPFAVTAGSANSLSIYKESPSGGSVGELVSTGTAAVNLNGGNTFVNTAFISGGTYGIYLSANGTIINTGTIEGGRYALYLLSGGIVNNSGRLATTGTIAGTYGVYSAGGITKITNTGTIAGRNAGIYLSVHTSGTPSDYVITNNGTITASAAASSGIYAEGSTSNGVTINNSPAAGGSGLISGDSYGIEIRCGGTINNSGAIEGRTAASGGSGIYVRTATTTINNYIGTVGGKITGGNGIFAAASITLNNDRTTSLVSGTGTDGYGVYLSAGGTIRNSGINNDGIRGTSGISYGIYSSSGTPSITNAVGAIISGNAHGIWLNTGGIVTNSGTISTGSAGITNYGIYSAGGVGKIANNGSGTITAGDAGIYYLVHTVGGTGDYTITNYGRITATRPNSSGIYAGGNATIGITINNYPIGGVAYIGGTLQGIDIRCGGEINNAGTGINGIRGTGATNSHGIVSRDAHISINNQNSAGLGGTILGVTNGIWAESSPMFLTNTASASLIQGGANGVLSAIGGNITNSGTIQGTGAAGTGIRCPGSATVISNTSDGGGPALISGVAAGIEISGGGSVDNTGTIQGTGADSNGVVINTTDINVNNDLGGLIKGSNSGVTATVYIGVYNSAAASRIEGAKQGLNILGGGMVFNYGTGTNGIRGTGTDGIGIRSAADLVVLNNSDAVIQGTKHGLYFTAGGTIGNYGTIEGTGAGSYGIQNTGGDTLSIYNHTATSVIEGASYGIGLGGNNSIDNRGVIKGAVNSIIADAGISAILTNRNQIIGHVTLADVVNYITLEAGSSIDGNFNTGTAATDLNFTGVLTASLICTVVTGTTDIGSNTKVSFDFDNFDPTVPAWYTTQTIVLIDGAPTMATEPGTKIFPKYGNKYLITIRDNEDLIATAVNIVTVTITGGGSVKASNGGTIFGTVSGTGGDIYVPISFPSIDLTATPSGIYVFEWFEIDGVGPNTGNPVTESISNDMEVKALFMLYFDVSGTVFEDGTANPIGDAEISYTITGVGSGTVWSDPVTGEYTIFDIPEGATLTVDDIKGVIGYLPVTPLPSFTVDNDHTDVHIYMAYTEVTVSGIITDTGGNMILVDVTITYAVGGTDRPPFTTAAGSYSISIPIYASFEVVSAVSAGYTEHSLPSYAEVATDILTADIVLFRSAAKQYFIAATSDEGSTISPSGTSAVPKGGSRTFRFSAADGYAISAVLVNGVPLPQSLLEKGSYTFTDVKANHTIEVRSAEAIVLEITVIKGNGHADYSTNERGFIPYTQAVIIPAHSFVSVIAFADDGYEFKEWRSAATVHSTPEISFDDVTVSLKLDLYFTEEKDDPGTGMPWWMPAVIVLLAAAGSLWLFFFRYRRSYEVVRVEHPAAVITCGDKARRKKAFPFTVEGYSGPVSYRVGEAGGSEWKHIIRGPDGVYRIPKGDVIGKITIECR